MGPEVVLPGDKKQGRVLVCVLASGIQAVLNWRIGREQRLPRAISSDASARKIAACVQ
jgi:hypothetical protein